MKILLTGASGRLGSGCYRELLDAGHEVTATDVWRRPDLPGRLKVGDLLNREFCYDVAEGAEVVVHVANNPSPSMSNAQGVFNDNVTMNMNVFQAATESGCRRFIYASSIQAMSSKRDRDYQPEKSHLSYLPIDGNSPQNPGNSYGLSKCVGEMQLQYFVKTGKADQAVAVRFPLLLAEPWISESRQRHAGRPGDLNPRGFFDEAFTWLSYEDSARLVAAIVARPLPGYRCYLPAHPQPRINAQPRQIVARFFGEVLHRGSPDDPLCDIRGITADTGWTPEVAMWT